MKRNYHTIDNQGRVNERRLSEFLTKNGQQLLPLVELVEQSRLVIDNLIDVTGRATIQAVLELSAEQVVGGPRQQGRARTGEIVRYGHQAGTVHLRERKLRVSKPRLRRRGNAKEDEVPVPAYAAMQDQEGLQTRMLDILIRGVSTRQYQEVVPAMAETVGVSRSNVSRALVEASEKELEQLLARRFDDVDLLVIYLDGMKFGDHMVIAALGVDSQGHKHVLGIQEGATENEAAVQDLLENLVERGVKPDCRRLFVVDGAKALRAGINAVFGTTNPVQRCRTHKLRNVLERLPEDQKDQVRAAMKAAWKCEHKTGIAKLKKLSEWLERDCPAAAGSLLEGLEECFTVNRLDLPPVLHRCLTTTNIIESPQSGVRARTRRVCRWQGAGMVKRWAAAAFVATAKNFRKLMGYEQLWTLAAILGRKAVASKEKVA